MGVGSHHDLHDPECAKLARYFLADTAGAGNERLADDLAQHIQDAVEDWLRLCAELVEKRL